MDISSILKLLKDKIGLSHESIGEEHIKKAIYNRMAHHGLESVNEYADLLAEEDEANELINLVVIPETWFFRDHIPYQALTNYVKNTWLPQSANSKLNIMSLPCATGEEPYSIAMALMGMGLSTTQFNIDAKDVSDRVINIAKRGIYSSYSFRGKVGDYQSKYFTEVEGGFELIDPVMKSVNFEIGNILDDHITDLGNKYDILFCRNLLIYFDRTTKDKAIKALSAILKPGGILFVGLAETERLSLWGFTSYNYPQSFSYLKTGESVVTAATLNDVIEEQNNGLSEAVVQANGSSAYSYSTKTYDLSAGEDNTDLPPVGEMKESVEGAVDEHKDNKQYFAELELMIEQGDIDEAEEKCEQLLKSGDSSAHLFYLLGSIAKLGNNLLQSEELLKKAIYLEPKNVKSLMALSAIAEEQGDEKKSEDYKRRVEMVKSRQNNDG